MEKQTASPWIKAVGDRYVQADGVDEQIIAVDRQSIEGPLHGKPRGLQDVDAIDFEGVAAPTAQAASARESCGRAPPGARAQAACYRPGADGTLRSSTTAAAKTAEQGAAPASSKPAMVRSRLCVQLARAARRHRIGKRNGV